MSIFQSAHYNVIYIRNDRFIHFLFRIEGSKERLLTQKAFGSLEALFRAVGKQYRSYIIYAGQPLIETSLSIHKSVQKREEIEQFIKHKLEQNPSIGEPLSFYYQREIAPQEEQYRYFVYGFSKVPYQIFTQSIEKKLYWEKLTAPSLLLHSYLEKSIFKKENYIAMYRYEDDDTMIVSANGVLLLSRFHEKETIEAIENFVSFALQRFKLESPYLLKMGDLKKMTVNVPEDAFNDTKELPAISQVEILKSIRKIPSFYNLMPQSIKKKHRFKKIERLLLSAIFTIFLLALFILFNSYQSYQEALRVNQSVSQRYHNALHSLDLISEDKLDQLRYLSDPKRYQAKQLLKHFIAITAVLRSEAQINLFEWDLADKGSLQMVLEFHYRNLSDYDRYYQKFLTVKQALKKNVPAIEVAHQNSFEKGRFLMTFIKRARSKRRRG